MKMPLVLCNISEFDGAVPGRKSGTMVGDFEVPNVLAQGWELTEKLRDTLVDGKSLRLYSDGITGRVVID